MLVKRQPKTCVVTSITYGTWRPNKKITLFHHFSLSQNFCSERSWNSLALKQKRVFVPFSILSLFALVLPRSNILLSHFCKKKTELALTLLILINKSFLKVSFDFESLPIAIWKHRYQSLKPRPSPKKTQIFTTKATNEFKRIQ